MAFKQFEVPDIGTVKIYRRRGTRSLRMSFSEEGTIRLTMPTWTPYKAGLAFVRQHKRWIASQARIPSTFQDGSVIAGHFTIRQHTSLSSPRTRLIANTLHVYIPTSQSITNNSVQTIIRNALERALKKKTEEVLLPRLQQLSAKHNIKYRSARVQRLKSRWGSCSSQKIITLNSRLLQLPAELIDYVLLHELCHTRQLNHGSGFYEFLEQLCPNYKALRKELRTYKPDLVVSDTA